ncbi:hypothetical protein MHTCC0001_24190 [Flavobacteriaceae bacterium MHTCC 0001]
MVGISLNAQEIKVEDAVYEVKEDLIFKNGVDITATLDAEQKAKIMAAYADKKQVLEKAEATQQQLEKEQEKAEKNLKKAEKEQKKAEKERKRTEKVLKQKERAQANFDRATQKHQAAQTKYTKLKAKGKLSPVDEGKWLKKIDRLNDNINKAKKKLK